MAREGALWWGADVSICAERGTAARGRALRSQRVTFDDVAHAARASLRVGAAARRAMAPGSLQRGAGAVGTAVALFALLLRVDAGGGAAALLRRAALLALCCACALAGFEAGAVHVSRCVLAWHLFSCAVPAALARRPG